MFTAQRAGNWGPCVCVCGLCRKIASLVYGCCARVREGGSGRGPAGVADEGGGWRETGPFLYGPLSNSRCHDERVYRYSLKEQSKNKPGRKYNPTLINSDFSISRHASVPGLFAARSCRTIRSCLPAAACEPAGPSRPAHQPSHSKVWLAASPSPYT